MDGGGCPAIVVEAHAESGKRRFDHGMIPVHQILRADPLIPGPHHDGHPHFVRTADEDNILAFHALEPGKQVGRQIGTRQMAQMHGTIGVGQGGRDEDALERCRRHQWLSRWWVGRRLTPNPHPGIHKDPFGL